MQAAKDVTMKIFSINFQIMQVIAVLAIGALACGTFTFTSSDGAAPGPAGEGLLGPEDGVRTLPPTWTPAPTNTLQPSPTRKPTQAATSTPTVPSAFITSLAQITSIAITASPLENEELANWQQIDTDNAEIWVPGDYQVFNFSDGFDEAFAQLFTGMTEAFVEAFSEIAEEEGGDPLPTVDSSEFEQDFPVDLVVAFDESSFTSVLLVAEPVEDETDLEMEMNRAVIEQLDPSVNLLDRVIVELPNFDAGRLIFEGVDQESGLLVKQVAYIILQGDKVWSIVYGTASDFFDDLFPTVFETSIKTFRIK